MNPIRSEFLGIEEQIDGMLTPKRSFTIDLGLMQRSTKNPETYPIVRQYLLGLIQNPDLAFSREYHVHYATRLVRAESGTISESN